MRRARTVGDPEFGRVEPCECQRAQIEGMTTERLQRLSNLGPLAQLRLTDEQASAEPWATGCRFADADDEDPGLLLVTGPAGSGRTRLSAEMANRRLAAGRPALYYVTADLFDRLRSVMNASGNSDFSFQRLFEHVRDARFLILDDIDRISPTDWAREKLYQLLNHRRNRGRRTVLVAATPNLASIGLDGFTVPVEQLELTTSDAQASAGAPYREFGGMTLSVLEQYTFERFREHGLGARGDAENLGSVKQMVQDWAAQLSGWLTLIGGTGVGKTHLAAAVANERLAAGDSVCFAVVPELLDALRASYRDDGEASFDAIFSAIKRVDLLVLDDLGAHQATEWANEKLYALCAYRYLGGAATMITMNVTPDELDPRLASRIMGSEHGMVVPVKAKDFRTDLSTELITRSRSPHSRRSPRRR